MPSPQLVLDGRCFVRAQAEHSGLPHRELNELLTRGELRQIVRGVYVDRRRPEDVALRASALALIRPQGTAIARRTAAWLRGVDVRGPTEREAPMPIECIVPAGRSPYRRPGMRCFEAPLSDDDIETVGGIPVTRPARTVVDLMRWLPPHMGLAAVDAFTRAGHVRQAEILVELDRWARARHVERARRLAWHCEPGAESFGESWTRLRLLDAGFPRPAVQVPLLRGDRVVYRLDMGYPDQRLGIEYDGMEFHGTNQQRVHDRRRREEIWREFGWSVIPVGVGEVMGLSMRFEDAVGEVLGREPAIARRAW